ncbi:HNH endonuclease [archaeon]|nr:HNH endonuclease [archaeon]
MKLTIDLVPQTAWGNSLYNFYKQNKAWDWHKIKQKVFDLEGKKCWICGHAEGPFEAHEFWRYNHKEKIQKLVGIHHLCGNCHKIKHFGFWTETETGLEKLKKENLTKIELIMHFCDVNNCLEKDFKEHKDKSFKLHAWRSQQEWKTDFSWIEKLNLNVIMPNTNLNSF